MATARIEVSRSDLIKAHRLLEEHLHKIEGTELWAYAEGWSDQRVVDEVGGTLTNIPKVSKIRVELFGKLEAKNFGSPAMDLGPIEKQLHELASKLHKVDHDLSKAENSAVKEGLFVLDLADRFNRLIDLLKMNHVCDARSLKVEIPK